MNFFNHRFKFYEIEFSEDIFSKIIIRKLEEPKIKRKNSGIHDHSPIKGEHINTLSPKDFQDNFISKSLFIKLREEEKKNSSQASDNNPMKNINKKQEMLTTPVQAYLNIPQYLINDPPILSSSKKSNRIFDDFVPQKLPEVLKEIKTKTNYY